MGVGDRGRGHVPPKIREKYFSGSYYVEFGHFSGKNHVKSGILLIFQANLIKIGYFDIFSGKNHVIVYFFHTHLSGKNVLPP